MKPSPARKKALEQHVRSYLACEMLNDEHLWKDVYDSSLDDEDWNTEADYIHKYIKRLAKEVKGGK